MAEPSEDDVPGLRILLVRLGATLFTLLVVFTTLAYFVRAPLEALGTWFVDSFGLVGLAVAVMIVDSLPLTHEPLLFLALSGGQGFWAVWAAGTIGSIAAGVLTWFLGRLLRRSERLQSTFHRYGVSRFLLRYGGWAVAIAAITPFPYAMTTWCAGAVGVPLHVVFLGSLMRGPKVLLYLSLMAAGWYMPDLVGQP